MLTFEFSSLTLATVTGLLCVAHLVISIDHKAQDLCPVPIPDCKVCVDDPATNPLKCKFVKNPKDCGTFFECVKDPTDDANPIIRGPIPCPSGETYSQALADLNEPKIPCSEDGYCGEECMCNQPCQVDGQLYADVQDCGNYYMCICPTLNPAECFSMPMSCKDDPTKHYFNGKECQENPMFCC